MPAAHQISQAVTVKVCNPDHNRLASDGERGAGLHEFTCTVIDHQHHLGHVVERHDGVQVTVSSEVPEGHGAGALCAAQGGVGFESDATRGDEHAGAGTDEYGDAVSTHIRAGDVDGTVPVEVDQVELLVGVHVREERLSHRLSEASLPVAQMDGDRMVIDQRGDQVEVAVVVDVGEDHGVHVRRVTVV